MKKTPPSNLKHQSMHAFSLIELLVVISIIGILIAIGMVSYTNIQQKARDATRRSDIQSIAQAMEQYYQDNNSYPEGITMTEIENYHARNINNDHQLTLKIRYDIFQKLTKMVFMTQVYAATGGGQGSDGDVDPALLSSYFSGPFPTTPKDDGSGEFEYKLTVDSEKTIFCTCAKLEAGGGNAADAGFFGVCNFDENVAEYGQYYCQANRQ